MIKLGEGSFGKVFRAFRKCDRKLIAIKFIGVSGGKAREVENKISFFREKKIIEILQPYNCSSLPDYEGSFYSLSKKGQIEYLIIATSSGDCNLLQLIRKRGKSGIPYRQDEALRIIKTLLQGMKVLQEARVYHSDIKLANIVVNSEKNTYQLVDFGLSSALPQYSHSVSMKALADGGTSNFVSHEKENYWNSLKKERNMTEKPPLFNPFKCDIYSLGVCFCMMIGGKKNASDKFLLILEKMLEKNWEQRPDAVSLDEYITLELPNIKSVEELSIRELKLIRDIKLQAEEQEDHKDLVKRLNEARLNDDRLEFLYTHLNKCKAKISSHNPTEFHEEIAWTFYQLGR